MKEIEDTASESGVLGSAHLKPTKVYSQFSRAYIPLSSTQKLLNKIQFAVKLGIEDYKLATNLEFFL